MTDMHQPEPSVEQIWNECLNVLEHRLGKPTFETCFKTTRPVSYLNNIIKISVPNDISKDHMESKFNRLISDALSSVIKKKCSLEFVIRDEGVKKERSEVDDLVEKIMREENDYNFLNSRFSFNTFVVGNSNHFAHAAALAVAEAPAKAYNPLFIYGGVGLGKTHLIHAIGHHCLMKNNSMRVVYVSTETFANELINSIGERQTTQFRNKYRNIDLLLVDDIQFLIGKERSQEEFFHTFNDLYGASKQIVISSDRPPKEIPTLEDRLRSRFEWGLIADIQSPDLETREAILRKKADLEKVSVPRDITAFIAEKIPSNIRELEGALIRVLAFASLKNLPISLETAQEALKEIIPSSKGKELSIPKIKQIVAEYFGLTVDELIANRRDQRIVRPRQIAMYLIREFTDSSLPMIGDEFGGKDHTTVIHAYEKIKASVNDPSISSSLKNLIDKLKSV